MPEFVCLRNRTFRIALGRDNQSWCLHLLDEVNRRTLFINSGIVVNRSAEERDHPLTDQILAIVTLPVGDAGAGDSGMETIGLGDGPHRHVAAIAPTRHAETRGIDRILRNRGINASEDVAKIAAAEVLHVGAGEISPLTVASARIR